MTLRIPAKVLLHVWSYDFYDMTLSTGKQRRHMIMRSLKISEKSTKNEGVYQQNGLYLSYQFPYSNENGTNRMLG